MKLLDKSKYEILIEPVKQVTFNTLFAEAVIEHKIAGEIFVNDPDNPQTYYIIHPYGMTLLLGDSDNKEFNDYFRDYALNSNNIRGRHEWMQAFPDTWSNVLPKLFGDKLITSSNNKEQQVRGIIELNTRVNFKFNEEDFLRLRKPVVDNDIKIVRTDRQVFREMPGSVVPACFWNTEDDFMKNGIGFSLYYKNKLASTAYSSCINDRQLELGIETVSEFRSKGFAQYACQALIEYCIKNKYEPIWACRLENTGSFKLAQKVGFTPSFELPYYRLSN